MAHGQDCTLKILLGILRTKPASFQIAEIALLATKEAKDLPAVWLLGAISNFLPYLFSFKKCVAYTGNNMRKQTPVPDKKEKDVSDPLQM